MKSCHTKTKPKPKPSPEDRLDIQAVKARAQEPYRPFRTVVRDLKRDGLL